MKLDGKVALFKILVFTRTKKYIYKIIKHKKSEQSTSIIFFLITALNFYLLCLGSLVSPSYLFMISAALSLSCLDQ